MIIVLDTNFLIYLIKHRAADQLKEMGGKLVVTSTVKEELRKPSLGVKEKAFAAAALELLDIWRVTTISSEVRDVDKSIIEAAKELKRGRERVYIATGDRKLICKLSALGIGNIELKRGRVLSLN